MKFIGGKLGLAGLFLSASIVSSQAHAWFFKKSFQETPSSTITDLVVQSGGEFDRNKYDYDILLNAVLAAGLEGALADPDADLTVFAPNDRAFIRLAQDLGYEGRSEEGAFNAIVDTLTVLGEGDPIPVLTNVLLYHVSPGEKSARKVLRSGEVTTLLEGATILPKGTRLVDNDPEFKNPKLRFWLRGLKANNGIIHTIDRVLIPADLPSTGQDDLPTITGTVVASGGDFDNNYHDFDLLLNAVLAAGLEGALADPEASLTVFAPNDLAFVKLARDLGYPGWDEAEAFAFIAAALTDLGGGELVPILTNVLLYHVSPGSKTLKDVFQQGEIDTLLEGATFEANHFTLVDNAPALKNPRILYRGANIETSNGRVHTISRVLIPVDIP